MADAAAAPFPAHPPRRWGKLLQTVLGLLLLGLGIPAAGVGIWHSRFRILKEYHYHFLRLNLDYSAEDSARHHLASLLRLPATEFDELAARLATTTPAHRKWLAREVMQQTLENRNFQLRNRSLSRNADTRLAILQHTEARLDLAIKIDPENLDLLRARASASGALGDLVTSSGFLKNYLALAAKQGKDTASEAMSARLGLAGSYIHQSRYQDAIDLLTPVEAYFPDNDDTRQGQAKAYARRARDVLLDCYERLGRYDKAIAIVSEKLATQEHYNQTSLLMSRALMLGLIGMHNAAERDLDAAMHRGDMDRNAENLARRLAYFRAQMGQIDDALKHFDTILKNRPQNAYALRQRAEMLADAGLYEQAWRDYEECVLLRPDDAQLLNSYAWQILITPDPAHRDVRRALELSRLACELTKHRNSYMLDTLGEAYYHNGLYAEAVEAEAAAVRLAGHIYQDSLTRFRKALQDHTAGKRVVHTISNLANHHLPAKPAQGITVDLSTLPATPRLSREMMQKALYDTGQQGSWVLLQKLARLYQDAKPTAVDNPKADLMALMRYVIKLKLANSDSLLFYYGAGWGSVDPSVAARTGLDEPAGIQIGARFCRWCSNLTQEQAGQFLSHIASGSWSLLEIMGLDLSGLPTQVQGSTQKEIDAYCNAQWLKIRTRLDEAATQDKIAPPPAEAQKIVEQYRKKPGMDNADALPQMRERWQLVRPPQ